MISVLAAAGPGCVTADEADALEVESSSEAALSSEAEALQAADLQALSRGPGDEVTSLACRWVYSQANTYNSGLGLWHTPTMSTSSGCGHLYVQKYTSGCVSARIRYYPSSGGSFTSGYQSVCNGWWAVFSVDVLAGTVFRVETTTSNAQFALDI
jgi:hypothetical protein